VGLLTHWTLRPAALAKLLLKRSHRHNPDPKDKRRGAARRSVVLTHLQPQPQIAPEHTIHAQAEVRRVCRLYRRVRRIEESSVSRNAEQPHRSRFPHRQHSIQQRIRRVVVVPLARDCRMILPRPQPAPRLPPGPARRERDSPRRSPPVQTAGRPPKSEMPARQTEPSEHPPGNSAHSSAAPPDRTRNPPEPIAKSIAASPSSAHSRPSTAPTNFSTASSLTHLV
jgi:hypothetical protein